MASSAPLHRPHPARPARPRRAPASLVSLALALAGVLLAGCGKAGHESAGSGGPARRLAPVAEQGAVSVATRNTTRLGGATPAADAAAVARAVYPGLTTATRPRTVVLVNEHDFNAALASAVLASAPVGAPILLADGNSLSELTRQTLEALHPVGLPSLAGAQVVRIGTSAGLPAGLIARDVPVSDPATTAARIARLAADASPTRPHAAIVLPVETAPAAQMPAAGLSAESGAPILYVTAGGVPAATVKALAAFGRHPAIYTLGQHRIAPATAAALRHIGLVTNMEGSSAGSDPVGVAIATARFSDGTFGWGVKEPGHGLVFANVSRPLDAAAAAPLSATADYGPLLLLPGPGALPAPLSSYLADIQPAYTSAPQFQPVRGVYNHGWLMGDESAISAVTQAQLDTLLEISPRGAQSPGEAAVAQSE